MCCITPPRIDSSLYLPLQLTRGRFFVLFQVLQQPQRGREEGAEAFCRAEEEGRPGQGHGQADAGHTAGPDQM